MRMTPGRALVVLALLAISAEGSAAQDTTVAPRHVLPVDTARMRPYRRTFDMIVTTKDSAVVIGERVVSLDSALYSGMPVWLLVETRTGIVPSVESLYVTRTARPLHWSASLGAARLGLEFVGDSIFGATSWPGGKSNVVLAGRPDLVVSTAMIEALFPLLPVGAAWSDSVGVLKVDLAGAGVIPAELSAIGEEEMRIDSTTARSVWVVALRAEAHNVLFWVDKETGAVFRVQQPLPPHVGSLLEFRMRE